MNTLSHHHSNARHWAFIAASVIAGAGIVGSRAVFAQVGITPAPIAPAPVVPVPAAPVPITAQPIVAGPSLTPTQLSDLTASIALYPDPLIAVMLPAATYPDQVVAANNWLAANPAPSEAAIDSLPYATSVKELIHYPTALSLMAQNLAWTQSLGMAFVYQQAGLMDSIQQWRSTAIADNTLYTTPEEQVLSADGTIQILPAVPDEIYVPTYDPGVVFSWHSGHPGLLHFDHPIAGNYLDHDMDWHDHQVRVPVNHTSVVPPRDEHATPPATPERNAFHRDDFHASNYPDRIVTPGDHRVIAPARAPEARGNEHPSAAPEARGNDHPAPAPAARGNDRGPAPAGGPDRGRGEANNHE